jgi:hypothetical protein
LNDLSKAGHSTTGADSPSEQTLSFKSFSKIFWTHKLFFFVKSLATGVLFASNDSKTSFEQRKNAR